MLRQRHSSFVADGIARGFTVCYAHPPRLPQLLTHGLLFLHCLRSLTLVRPLTLWLWPHRPATGATTAFADFSLRFAPSGLHPQGEISPGKGRTPSPHNRRIYAAQALVTKASRFHARSPCLAAPSMRFLSIGSRFTLHASFPHSVALMQLRFTSLAVTSSWRDLHPQECAHAGRT